jgi:uncharacterized protein
MSNRTTAIVTGSASGIGLEMAKILAAKGYDLYLADINEKGLNTLKTDIQSQHSVEVIIQCIDLSLPEAADIIHKDCIEKNLDVEILINNAGFFFFSEVAEANPDKSSMMIHVHMHTPSLLAIHFAKQMKEKRRGFIMMTSSISAYKDFPGIGFYAASKAYIKSFCKSMRLEMKYYGVHVTALCPGATATNLYDPNVINVELGKKWGIMLSAEKVAKDGINGMFKNKAVVIPGFTTKVMTFLSILTPSWLIYWARVKWKRFF